MLSHWGFFSIEQLFWYQCHCGRASMLNDQCYCRRIIRLLLIIQALNCTHNGYFQKYIFFKQLEKSFGSIILELDYKNHCFVVNLFLLTIPIIVLLSIFFLLDAFLFRIDQILLHHCPGLREGLARLQAN